MLSRVAVLAAVLLGVTGCSDSSPAAPDLDQGIEFARVGPIGNQSLTQAGDSVWWDTNGEMRYVDDFGDTITFKRYGSTSAPTHMEMYQNGTLVGKVELDWAGSTASVYTFDHADDPDWISTDDKADPIDASWGDPNGDGCEANFTFGLEEPGCCESETQLIDDGECSGGATLEFSFDLTTGQMLEEPDCTDERNEFIGRAAVTIAGAGISGALAAAVIITKAPLVRVTVRSIVATGVALKYSLDSAKEWAICEGLLEPN